MGQEIRATAYRLGRHELPHTVKMPEESGAAGQFLPSLVKPRIAYESGPHAAILEPLHVPR